MLNADTAGSGGGQRYMPDAAGEWLCEVLQSIAILRVNGNSPGQDGTCFLRRTGCLSLLSACQYRAGLWSRDG